MRQVLDRYGLALLLVAAIWIWAINVALSPR